MIMFNSKDYFQAEIIGHDILDYGQPNPFELYAKPQFELTVRDVLTVEGLDNGIPDDGWFGF